MIDEKVMLNGVRYILQAPNCWHQFNSPFGSNRQRNDPHAAGEDGAVHEGGV